MTCDFTSFPTIFQSYQDDGWVIMEGCVQWNPVINKRPSSKVGLEPGTARSAGQRLIHWATASPNQSNFIPISLCLLDYHICRNYHTCSKTSTLMCLSIGTPKNNIFSISPFQMKNSLFSDAPLIIMCLNIGTPKNHKFSIWNKWKINGFRCPNT